MVQVIGSLLPIWETQIEAPAPGLSWPNLGCWEHLGSEAADGRFLCLPVFCVCFQVNLKK